MKIYIRNMVCSRCKMAVRSAFENEGVPLQAVELGEVELAEEPSPEKLNTIKTALSDLGFEMIDDKRSRIIEKIKTSIVEHIHYKNEEQQRINLSDYIVQQLHYDYNYLSNLFSEVEGTTIEKYAIAQKIEKVKELLKYDELSLSEIAFRLGYSSVGYLSNQFKKETGLSPSFYKNQKANTRKNLDNL